MCRLLHRSRRMGQRPAFQHPQRSAGGERHPLYHPRFPARHHVLCPTQIRRRRPFDSAYEPKQDASYLPLDPRYGLLLWPVGLYRYPLCAVHTGKVSVGLLHYREEVLEPLVVGTLFYGCWQ